METLYDKAARRFYSVHPDWKHDSALAYERWRDDKSEETLMAIVDAIAPGIFYISYRYAGRMDREEAFDAGVAMIPRSLALFDPSKSPRGAEEVGSYIMWLAEKGMSRACEHASIWDDHVVSLEKFEVGTWDHLSVQDAYELRPSVMDVVLREMQDMSQSDRAITEWRLLDGMSWENMALEASRAGLRLTNRNAISARFSQAIVPKLKKALISAGYDENDM
jgi:hypothetical protein